jgi:outer membrane protein OmpA-like peptidoglycan-associated protein
MKRTKVFLSILTLASVLGMAGCATTSQVDQKIAAAQGETDKKIESIAGQVEDLQEKQRATDVKLDELSKSAQEALTRANEAGMIAKGKVVFEQTLSDDTVKFKSDSFDLTDDAKAALDALAGRIKGLNRAVYIEIQGHTDNRGSESYNDMLAQNRAEAVRRYLNRQHNLPLPRMSTISYGESMALGDNATRAGRTQNRRVVVIVLE